MRFSISIFEPTKIPRAVHIPRASARLSNVIKLRAAPTDNPTLMPKEVLAVFLEYSSFIAYL